MNKFIRKALNFLKKESTKNERGKSRIVSGGRDTVFYVVGHRRCEVVVELLASQKPERLLYQQSVTHWAATTKEAQTEFLTDEEREKVLLEVVEHFKKRGTECRLV
jgi:hypothetical protein